MPTAKTELGAATLNGEVYAAVPREELIDQAVPREELIDQAVPREELIDQADPRALGDVAGVEQLVDPVVDLLLSRAAIGEMLDEVLVRDVVATAALLAIAGGSRPRSGRIGARNQAGGFRINRKQGVVGQWLF